MVSYLVQKMVFSELGGLSFFEEVLEDIGLISEGCAHGALNTFIYVVGKRLRQLRFYVHFQ
jgi:hypothetical protein